MKKKVFIVMMTAMVLLTACSHDDGPAPANDNAAVETALTTSPSLTWQIGPAGLSEPISKDAGPFEMSPVPHGFSQPPHGALLAAMTAQIWMAGADDENWPKVAEYLLEPGVGRDQWAQSRALVSVKGIVQNPAHFVGFKFSKYNDKEALVVLAAKWSDGMLTAYPVQLSFATGQWRVVIPPQDQAPDLEKITEEQLKDFVMLRKG